MPLEIFDALREEEDVSLAFSWVCILLVTPSTKLSSAFVAVIPKFVIALPCCVAVSPWDAVSTLSLFPNDVDVVVAKFESSPRAAASSLRVFRALGAESTTPATCASTYAFTDCCVGTLVALLVENESSSIKVMPEIVPSLNEDP